MDESKQTQIKQWENWVLHYFISFISLQAIGPFSHYNLYNDKKYINQHNGLKKQELKYKQRDNIYNNGKNKSFQTWREFSACLMKLESDWQTLVELLFTREHNLCKLGWEV